MRYIRSKHFYIQLFLEFQLKALYSELAEFLQQHLAIHFKYIMLEYLLKNEWATNSADILWRRSKLGLHVPADTAPEDVIGLAQQVRKN